MSHDEMLSAHPDPPTAIDRDLLAAAIQACFECAQACAACADACLSEDAVAELTACIRSDLDCADMCEATGRLLSRYSGQNDNLVRAFLDTCAAACRTCGDECAEHADRHEHCRICAEACRRCERACQELVAALG